MTHELEKQIKELMEKNNVVIVKVIHRSSEGYYNYKLREVWIRYEPRDYEEQDDIEELEITTGAFQEYSLIDVHEVLEKYGFEKIFEA